MRRCGIRMIISLVLLCFSRFYFSYFNSIIPCGRKICETVTVLFPALYYQLIANLERKSFPGVHNMSYPQRVLNIKNTKPRDVLLHGDVSSLPESFSLPKSSYPSNLYPAGEQKQRCRKAIT